MLRTMGARIDSTDRERFDQTGYILLRQAFTPARVGALRDAVARMLDRARHIDTREVRWNDDEKRVPNRIGQLLSPDKYDDEFGRWLDEDLSPQIETLLEGPGRHSLFGMIGGGGGKPYKLAWHRDLGKPGAPDEVQYMARYHRRFVQFNAPLLEGDTFLHIVPASHSRASTQAEIAASAAGDNADMPDAMVVQLNPGDIAWYDANLWHRGWNPTGLPRQTLHAAFWQQKYKVMSHEYGQREALLTPGHLERLPPITRQYIQRYLDAYPAAGEAKRVQDIDG
jgi:nicotinamide N-methyltransferase